MTIQNTPALRAFRDALPTGERVKAHRHVALSPGGRVALTLFERAHPDDRPHPRLRVRLPDPPSVPTPSLPLPHPHPSTAAGFLTWATAAWQRARPDIEDTGPPPAHSPRFHHNRLRTARTAALFSQLHKALASWARLSDAAPDSAAHAARGLASLEATAYAGDVRFDDDDTGTYHSFQHDAPFVHHLETALADLPTDGDISMDLLSGEQQASVRRQRAQAQAWLDHLMRHKYAHDGILETDIERSAGGLLIDRRTRRIVSETPETASSLQPKYELLRIPPDLDHGFAGVWVHDDGLGGLRTEAAEAVQIDRSLLRRRAVHADALTLRRAPGSALLRPGIRLDWTGDAQVQPAPISWVDWAGHCDIKAVLEAVGLSLADQPSVLEYRSDTDRTGRWSRDLLLEGLAALIECGSAHERVDDGEALMRGVHRFGGARNDARPDRLQFAGPGEDGGLRWPLSPSADALQVVALRQGDITLDVDEAVARHTPRPDGPGFDPNPRFLKTVDGDCNLIDVSGMQIDVRVQSQAYDPATGYPTWRHDTRTLDLSPDADPAPVDLGSHPRDAAARSLWRLRYLPGERRLEARAERWIHSDAGWAAEPMPAETIAIPLHWPPVVTLSRELRRDDPGIFQALLGNALRQGEGICADTDAAAPVWNGVVTRISSEQEAREGPFEQWRVRIEARFGVATLRYRLRRDPAGAPDAWCAISAPGDDATPDFLWQDHPDVAAKGVENGDWIVNQSMRSREIITLSHNPAVAGDTYVHDDHVKNLSELLWCGLSERRWAVVHENKRYVYDSEEQWRADCDRLAGLRRDACADPPQVPGGPSAEV